MGTVCFLLGKSDLAYLQDQLIHNATTLADILPNTLEESQVVSTHIQAIRRHNILFVFDEWDEFPSYLQTNSLVSTIIHQPHKLSLHQSTILIAMYLCWCVSGDSFLDLVQSLPRQLWSTSVSTQPREDRLIV